MALVEVKVPDIGDFKDVAVIELLVKPGDTIKPEQSLITVESDKASMEIPASQGGVVKELKVKLGDKVKEGSVILLLEAQEQSTAASSSTPPTTQGQAEGALRADNSLATPQARSRERESEVAYIGPVDMECDVLVLGAGPGGYSAAFRAADLRLKVV